VVGAAVASAKPAAAQENSGHEADVQRPPHALEGQQWC